MFFLLHFIRLLRNRSNWLALLLSVIVVIFIQKSPKFEIILRYPVTLLTIISFFIAIYFSMGNGSKEYLEERIEHRTDITFFYAKSLIKTLSEIALSITVFIFLCVVLVDVIFISCTYYLNGIDFKVFISKELIIFNCFLLPVTIYSLIFYTGTLIIKTKNAKNSSMMVNLIFMVILMSICFGSGFLSSLLINYFEENFVNIIVFLILFIALLVLNFFSIKNIKKLEQEELYFFHDNL